MPPRRRRARAPPVVSQDQGSQHADDNTDRRPENGDSVSQEREGSNPEDEEEFEEEVQSESLVGEGPGGNPMDQFMDLLRRNLNQHPHQQRSGGSVANTFRAFNSLKPPEFRGTADPVEARAWVKEMEKSFEIIEIADEQKTVFLAYLLKGEANFWWEAKKSMEGAGVVTWDRFKELFLEKYFPRYMVSQMELKFLELKQGNMTIAEYEAKFSELSRFVPEFVDTEAKRARRFQQGLKTWILNRVAIFEYTDYATLVQKASIVEAGSEQSQRDREEKKRKGNHQGGSSVSRKFSKKGNRGATSQPAQSAAPQRAGSWSVSQGGRQSGATQSNRTRPPLPECNKCKRRHTGTCNAPTMFPMWKRRAVRQRLPYGRT